MDILNTTEDPSENYLFKISHLNETLNSTEQDLSWHDATNDDYLIAFPVSSGLAFITVITGGIGNTLLIYLSFLKSKLMTVINQLLLLQCIINLSECIFLIPIRSFLIGTAIRFPARNQLCRVVLSWTYANWGNFCLSLLVVSTVRLLYVVAPLKMHNVRDRTVIIISQLLLGLSQLAWFISSMLVEERPFGSASCMTGKYEHASIRIVLSIVFNLSCVLLTLATYIGITVFSKPSVTSDNKQRNIITVKTGIIQSVFMLLTFLMPIVTRLLSYRGLISSLTLAQGNMLWINFSQCSVYPLLTICSSSVLRKEAMKIIKSFLDDLRPRNSRRHRRIEPLVHFSAPRESSECSCEKTADRMSKKKSSATSCRPGNNNKVADDSVFSIDTSADTQYSSGFVSYQQDISIGTNLNVFKAKSCTIQEEKTPRGTAVNESPEDGEHENLKSVSSLELTNVSDESVTNGDIVNSQIDANGHVTKS